jgi:hypothetical protein
MPTEVTPMSDTYLLDLATRIAAGRIEFSGCGVPNDLAVAVRGMTGLGDGPSLLVAQLMLRAMLAMRAIDQRDRDRDYSDDFDDCS